MAAKKSSGLSQKSGDTRRPRGGRLKRVGKGDGPVSRQSRAFDEHLADVLAKALNEWMARNPEKSVDDVNFTAVLPEALEEFIWRHLDDSEG